MNASPTQLDRSVRISGYATKLWVNFVTQVLGVGGSAATQHITKSLRDQIERNRLVRVPSYCAICAAGWAFFGFYYSLRNAPYSAMLCVPVSVLLVGLCVFSIQKPAHRKYCANLQLALNFVGLLTESFISGLSESSTLLFLCCLGVMAAHQSGIRVAIIWTLLCSAAVAAIHFCFDRTEWPLLRSPNLVDDATSFAGVFLLVTWMAAQAEWFATKYYMLMFNNANELLHLAEHDQLTQLANRYRFRNELDEAKETFQKTGKQFGLLMLDLDSFKDVNDTLGHLAGDAVLKEVARRLELVVDDEHTISRMGGDEFTVIVRGATLEKLEQIGNEIIHVLDEPVLVSDRELPISVSVGAAMVPTHTRCTDELQAFADLAIYAAKESDVSISFYTSCMTEKLARKQSLLEKLSRAMEEQEFSLVYQPQVCMTSGRIIGAEALLRWQHVLHNGGAAGESGRPQIEWISPAEFVPVLESTGQILDVGKWVLEEACQQVKVWLNMGIECCVSVNVSPVQFRSAAFVQVVLDVLHESQIPPHCLDLEVTEGVMVDRLKETHGKLQQLKDAGVKISVDDFGTGYSSLAYLKHLPLDRLKIDRVFVKDIPDGDDGSIATSIINLAHSLGLTVVAEGVETEEQLEFLTYSDCETYQGYFFSKPVSASACTTMLLQKHRVADLELAELHSS